MRLSISRGPEKIDYDRGWEITVWLKPKNQQRGTCSTLTVWFLGSLIKNKEIDVAMIANKQSDDKKWLSLPNSLRRHRQRADKMIEIGNNSWERVTNRSKQGKQDFTDKEKHAILEICIQTCSIWKIILH